MSDDDAVDVERGERDDPVLDRSVQTASGSPQHVGAGAARPGRDFVVVAHHEHGERARGADDAIGHSTSER